MEGRNADPRAIPFADLIDLIRAGDRPALAEFHRRYEPFLRRVARRWMGPAVRRHADSTDMVQSVFRQVLPRLAHAAFERESKVRAWLATIMRARVARLGRRLRGPGDAAIEPLPEDILAGDGTASPAEAAEQAELVYRMKSALESLSPDEREVLLLREFEDLPFEEIAGRLGRPSADAARKLHDRARRRLRGMLEDGAA